MTTSDFNTYTVSTYHVESKEDMLKRVIAAEDVGLPGIGDRVYQHGSYRVCVEIAGRHIEPSCKWSQKKNNIEQAAGKQFVSGHEFLCKP